MARKIEKRGKNSYRLTVAAGYSPDGKQIFHRKTVHCSDKDAKKQYALFVADIEAGNTANSGKLNLYDFCKIWIRDHAERHLAPKTVQRYKQLLNLQILPVLGHIQLSKLKPPQIIAFYSDLEKRGIRKDDNPGCLSPRTRLHIHRLLHTILETAVQWEYLNTNPAAKVKAPRATKAHIKILNEEQTAAFIQQLDKAALKWKTLFLLTLAAGLRLSEAMGIEWKHIDLNQGTLSIEQSSHYINKVGIITSGTKNQSSERLISLPDSITELLKQYRVHQNTEREQLGDNWKDHDRLFTQWNGKPMYPGSFNSWLKNFCTKNKLPQTTPHSLRHLSATILINTGISLKNISARLGHQRTSTTSDIYSHFLKSTDKAAAEKMDKFLSISQAKKQSPDSEGTEA